MSKNSALDEALIGVINKATAVTGDAIDGVKSVTGKTVDFVIAQAPELIHQLLVWKLIEAILYFVLSIISIILCVHFTKKFFESSDGVILIFTGVLGILSIILSISSFSNILQISFAPKIYLIEYAAHLLGKS